MSLARALVPAFLALSLLLSPIQAAAQMSDVRRIPIPSEKIQARGIKVLAALLVALSAAGPHGGVPPDRVAEAENLTQKLIEENARHPLPMPLQLRRIADAESRGRRNAPPNAKDYKILHTFSVPITKMSLPITDAFAAPCDGRKVGWPRADASETPRAECTRAVHGGERLRLSDGLHRRRWDSLPDVLLGQNAPPSPDRMNLDGKSRTNVPALLIANW